MPFGLKAKPLIVVSVFILLSDLIFIAFNYYSSLDTIHADTRRWAREAQQVFALTLDGKSTSMQQLAEFVGNMPEVKNLFRQGKTAFDNRIDLEGEDTLAIVRRQLYEYVRPSWNKLTSQYDVRQLHFHFGPGSTSFLRVHRPDKFGDDMDQVRFTVVDVNQRHRPVKGFETGRVYSGIRGVVPISFGIKGADLHLGALEAGTSFTDMLKSLNKELEGDIAVLLSEDHVRRNMWPEFIKNHFGDDGMVGGYFVESTTSPETRRFLALKEVSKLLKSGRGSDFILGGQVWQVCVFPLRDYRGTTDPDLPDSGVVVVWKEATEKWELLRASLVNNIIYALIALIVVEAVLILGWQYSQQRLNQIIRDQTGELKKLASMDGLTGIFNRRHIEKSLQEEVYRANRHGSTLSVIIFDIDHFKKVNDTYGHNAGDEVLKSIADCVSNLIRTSDKIGRWGGEEFLVLAPETPIQEANALAERIRSAVAKTQYAGAAPVTVSLGIAQYQPKESAETVVHRADEALYQAKEIGRNRAVTAD